MPAILPLERELLVGDETTRPRMHHQHHRQLVVVTRSVDHEVATHPGYQQHEAERCGPEPDAPTPFQHGKDHQTGERDRNECRYADERRDITGCEMQQNLWHCFFL